MNYVLIIAGIIAVYIFSTRTLVQSGTLITGGNLLLEIRDKYGKFARSISIDTGVPTALILALIRVESAGDADARGSIGEVGLMQLTEGAWEDIIRFGGMTWRSQEIPRDPYSNILAGAKYLVICDERMGSYVSDPVWFDALRAYNIGANAALKNRIKGTNYAYKVLSFEKLFARGF